MPIRATKRGNERTPLDADADVLICGASFAGLAAARELAGSGARVLVVDRYEIGERQTSACAVPTQWPAALGLEASVLQTFDEVVINRPRGGSGPRRQVRWRIPWSFSTFDYRRLCELLAAQGDFDFETAKVDSIDRGDVHTVHTDRGPLRAPLVLDALGWRRVLSEEAEPIQPPAGFLSRGLEVHPPASSPDLELWLDPHYLAPGYAWSFPAADEVRVGVGSFDPTLSVKDPTVRLAGDLGLALEGYQGNWIPHRLRRAAAGGVFFAGDSAGHCFPATAEGIRPALYFGLAAGREMRAVFEGRSGRGEALVRYAALSASKRHVYEALYRVQQALGHLNRGHGMDLLLAALSRQRAVDYCFGRYIDVTPIAEVTSGEPRPISPPTRSALTPR